MTKFKEAIRYFHEERFDYDPAQTVLKNFKAWLTPMRYEREYNGDKPITDREAWEGFKIRYKNEIQSR